jgi:enoyl-CoA hydratase/carnithine racemase
VVNLAETYAPSDGVGAGLLDRVVEPSELLPSAAVVAAGLGQLNPTAHSATKALARQPAIEAIRHALELDRAVFELLGGARAGGG